MAKPLFLLASPAGFEPATYGLEGRKKGILRGVYISFYETKNAIKTLRNNDLVFIIRSRVFRRFQGVASNQRLQKVLQILG